MKTPEQFPHAPITEAVLDISVTLPSHVDLAQLLTLQETIRDRYAWQSHFHAAPDALQFSQPTGGVQGYLFTSADTRQVVQARLDGFTFSRLKPYQSWKVFRDEGQELWQHYTQTATPERITRVALRYINRIEIPLPIGDFKDYILTTPEIAPDLPQELASAFMRLVLRISAHNVAAIVTYAFEPLSDGSSKILPLIFDIDVLRRVDFVADAEELWDIFETLHTVKNDIFFNSITDKAKELFR